MSDTQLASLLTSDLLYAMAGDITYSRGLAYAQEDCVQEVTMQDGVLSARVNGTKTYSVQLSVEGSRLSYDCTCPVGDELRFCKHCVAAGLAWMLARKDASAEKKTRRQPAEDPMERVRAFLERQDAETLRELLLAEADANENLRERLLLRDAAANADPASLKRLRAAIDRATTIHDFVDYYAAPAYAGVLDEMVDGVAAVARENPAAAVELAEHAIWRVEAALSDTDDSDGEVSGVLARLNELHQEACLQARPDPVVLARRLFQGEMRSQFDSFYGAAGLYEEVLGETGLAEYRRLAHAAWDRLLPLGPGERDTDPELRRWRITNMMEALAKSNGDVEEQVAVRSRDLSQPHAFLHIAEIYREAGDHDRAMEWARRGLDSFPSHQNSRLRTFLADEHHRRGEHEQAMDLAWLVFADRPHLAEFKLLKEHADQTRSWTSWRERALARMREHAKQRIAGMIRLAGRAPDERSELVRVFLWERDVEAAWREAQEGGCSSELWLQLAQLREAGYPVDSLTVYRKQVDRILIDTGDRAYTEAVKLLPRIRETMNRVGEDFPAYLTALRTTHKRRRKLLEMIDRFERRPVTR